MLAVTDDEAAEVIEFEDARFEIDARLSAAERQDHARMQVAIEQILTSRGFGAYTAHFTEMYAMDFPSDSVLMSHMGEGNWKIVRSDRPVRLIKRPLGIGRLADPPTFLFQYQPGPATIATLVSLEGERFRLVVAEGENLDSQELPALEMPYGQFRPGTGLRGCLNGWLAAGGPHHEVMNLGHHAASWRTFCQLAGIEFVQV
jgi:L-arabinose isomerase